MICYLVRLFVWCVVYIMYLCICVTLCLCLPGTETEIETGTEAGTVVVAIEVMMTLPAMGPMNVVVSTEAPLSRIPTLSVFLLLLFLV